ncbi:MAG: amidase family protein, partial [Pseudomonadota bacterium]
MASTEFAFLSAHRLAELIKSKEVGCEELLTHYLDRVERHNPALNAIIVLDAERAIGQAKAADKALANGDDCGPLHGVPMTIKESYDVAGLPTTFGDPAFKDNVATEDALSVSRLKEAGAIIFGKTNVPLRLADFQSYNDIYGTTNNPWDTDRGPGGSSGGSAAALAAGLTGFESGSDIGGSIRNPAHFCGVFGHKPTWGLLPPRGHALPGIKAQSDLSVIGPMGRSADDLQLGVDVMAGPDEIHARGLRLQLPKPTQRHLGDYRVAVWAQEPFAPVSSDTTERLMAIGRCIERAGGEVSYDARPAFSATHAWDVFQTLLQATMMSRAGPDAYRAMQDKVAGLDPNDDSPRAQTMRA